MAKRNTIVGLDALLLFINNANMSVGMVTVRHMIFKELIARINTEEGIEEAKTVFKFCFGNENDEETGIEYESPLYFYDDEDGIRCVEIFPEDVDVIYESARTMKMSKLNIMMCCQDLTYAGRMYQELTIDAAKTMDDINIPYGEDMACIHLMSRERDNGSFNAVCDWEYMNATTLEKEQLENNAWQRSGNIRYHLNDKESYTYTNYKGEPVYCVHDMYHNFRANGLTETIEFFNEMMEVPQEWEKVRQDILQLGTRCEIATAREYAEFFQDAYRTIMSYNTAHMQELYMLYGMSHDTDDDLRAHIAELSMEVDNAYEAITDVLRSEMVKLGLTARERTLIMIDTVLRGDRNSSYGHVIMGEEFFLYALECLGDQYTEDPLEYCDIEDGTQVEFNGGYAITYDGFRAIGDRRLNGWYEIYEGKAYRNVKDLAEVPPVKNDRLVVLTRGSGGNDSDYTCTHVYEILKRLEGHEVGLITFDKNNPHVKDAICVIDEDEWQMVGQFRCSLTQGVSIPLNCLYGGKKGRVSQVFVVPNSTGNGDTAMLVLDDVETVRIPETVRGLEDDSFEVTEDDCEIITTTPYVVEATNSAAADLSFLEFGE